MIKRLFKIGLSICICALLSAGAGCAKKPAPKAPIKISINVWPGYAFAYLAQEKGFFKKNNVAVELILGETFSESMKFFTDGDVDGCFAVFANIIMINANGIPARVVCIIDYSNTGDVIIGRPQIQSLAGLKGKTVSFEGVNTFSQIFVLNALEKAGLSASDVRCANVKVFDVLTALEENRIDAGHTWEPVKSQALKKGYKILAVAGDSPGIITDVLAFSTGIIKERPDDIRAIVKSLFEALDYLKGHRDEAVKIMADKMGMSAEEMVSGIEGVYQPDLNENLSLLTTTTTTMPSLYNAGRFIADFYLHRGQLLHDVDIKEVIEPKFIEELTNK